MQCDFRTPLYKLIVYVPIIHYNSRSYDLMLFLMVPSFCLKNATGPNDVADVVGHIRSYIWSTDRYTALAPIIGGDAPVPPSRLLRGRSPRPPPPLTPLFRVSRLYCLLCLAPERLSPESAANPRSSWMHRHTVISMVGCRLEAAP